MKCKIQWIDCDGNPTPDDNEAIGYAVLTNPNRYLGPDRYPICAAHAAKMGNARSHHGECSHVTIDPSAWRFERF